MGRLKAAPTSARAGDYIASPFSLSFTCVKRRARWRGRRWSGAPARRRSTQAAGTRRREQPGSPYRCIPAPAPAVTPLAVGP